LVHVARHAVHGVGEEDRIKSAVATRRRIPGWWVLYDSCESLGPVVFHTQRHREGQEFFKSVRRHTLQTVGIHTRHELLEPKHMNPGLSALHGVGSHLACKEPPDNRRYNA